MKKIRMILTQMMKRKQKISSTKTVLYLVKMITRVSRLYKM